MVLATHDVEVVAAVADRAVVLAEGEVVADGPARDVVVHSPVFAPQVAKILAPAPWLTVAEVAAALERDAGGEPAGRGRARDDRRTHRAPGPGPARPSRPPSTVRPGRARRAARSGRRRLAPAGAPGRGERPRRGRLRLAPAHLGPGLGRPGPLGRRPLDLRRARAARCWAWSWPSWPRGPSTPRRWPCSACWPPAGPPCASPAAAWRGSSRCSSSSSRPGGCSDGASASCSAPSRCSSPRCSPVAWGPGCRSRCSAAAWIGFFAGCLPELRGRAEIAMLAGYAAVASLAYGLVMNLWFWPFVTDGSTGLSYEAGAGLADQPPPLLGLQPGHLSRLRPAPCGVHRAVRPARRPPRARRPASGVAPGRLRSRGRVRAGGTTRTTAGELTLRPVSRWGHGHRVRQPSSARSRDRRPRDRRDPGSGQPRRSPPRPG